MWLEGKGVCLHFKGQGIKLHEWCRRVPNSLKGSNVSLKLKTTKGKKLGHTPWLATL